MIKIFYSVESGRQRGSLCNLRNNLGHRNVSENTNTCFDHTYELLQDVCSVYVLCAASHLCGKKILDSDDPLSQNDLENLAMYTCFALYLL